MSDDNNGDDGFPFYGIVSIILVGAWVFCCCITTKCCTDCKYDDRNALRRLEDDPVWRTHHGNTSESDRRLAIQMQRQELQNQNLTPEQLEEIAREREARVRSRTEFVQQSLVCYDYQSERKQDQVPHQDHDVEEGLPQCAICMETLKTGDKMTRATSGKCDHFFHFDCISDWFIKSSHCPICRNIFMEGDLLREQHKQSNEEPGDSPNQRSSDSSTTAPESISVSEDTVGGAGGNDSTTEARNQTQS